jgi:hypothetical protein
VGDGRSFYQAVRALDKLIAEHATGREAHQPEPDPVRRAYERIVNGTSSPQH